MHIGLAQERLDARQEYQEGEEQSRLRERLRSYDLQDFLLEEFESGDYGKAIAEMMTVITTKINTTRERIAYLEWKRNTDSKSNYSAINGECLTLKKELARMIAETIEDFGGIDGYARVKNTFVENAIDHETPLCKSAKEKI